MLSEALGTALGQRGVDLEVIVVDDASRDETAEQLAAIGDPHLHVIRHAHPQGPSLSRNDGIARARGEWLAFLDDDDLWAPDNLSTRLVALKRREADFAYSRVVLVDEVKTPLFLFDAPDPDNLLLGLLEANIIPGGPSNLIARTSLVRAFGGFDKRVEPVEDWDLAIRLATVGRAAACPETLTAYRQHGAKISGDPGFDPEAAFRRLTEKHAALSTRYGVDFDGDRVAHWISRERRRRIVSRAAHESARGRRALAASLYLRSGIKGRRLDTLRRAASELLPGQSRRRAASTSVPASLGAQVAWLASTGSISQLEAE